MGNSCESIRSSWQKKKRNWNGGMRRIRFWNRNTIRKNSYQQSTEIVQFYREKADIAATFPTDKEAIPEWAEKHFSDSLIFTQRARNSLRKFSSKLDLAVICDGILYLSAYGKFRQGNLSEELLDMHIKYGIKAKGLARLYFCWNEELQKIVLGYLPSHLPTLKNPT